jgi:hypothetical protein
MKKHRLKTGRPTKLTPGVVTKICGMIGRGLNYCQAAEAVGIHRDTFNEWAKTNSDFSDALLRAKGEGIDRRLKRIEQAARKGNWQADAWWLERVCRDQFGRNRLELSAPDEKPQQPGTEPQIDVKKLSIEKLKLLEELLMEAAAVEVPTTNKEMGLP